jgi:prepilin-type N-terminal cleavage/methylation domain-containing protein/prepilin-type processing-associated H-X9-DG protein
MSEIPSYERYPEPPARPFTLLELLVVVSIIAVLAAILFPVFAVNRHPRRAICGSNVKQLATALAMYTQDADERLPPDTAPASTLPHLLHPYLKNHSVWTCPTDTRRLAFDGTPTDATVGYGYNWQGLTRGGEGVLLSAVADPARTVALVEAGGLRPMLPDLPTATGSPLEYRHPASATPREAGMQVGWLDGHVKWTRQAQLEERQAGRGIDGYRYWSRR